MSVIRLFTYCFSLLSAKMYSIEFIIKSQMKLMSTWNTFNNILYSFDRVVQKTPLSSVAMQNGIWCVMNWRTWCSWTDFVIPQASVEVRQHSRIIKNSLLPSIKSGRIITDWNLEFLVKLPIFPTSAVIWMQMGAVS